MIATYPSIRRNQWHDGHNYTLLLTSTISMGLSVGEFASLKASVSEIERIENPTPEDRAEIRRMLDEIRRK